MLYSIYSEIEAKPGSGGNVRDTDKETPVFGIRLTHPGSARAWEMVFRRLADEMERDALTEIETEDESHANE